MAKDICGINWIKNRADYIKRLKEDIEFLEKPIDDMKVDELDFNRLDKVNNLINEVDETLKQQTIKQKSKWSKKKKELEAESDLIKKTETDNKRVAKRIAEIEEEIKNIGTKFGNYDEYLEKARKKEQKEALDKQRIEELKWEHWDIIRENIELKDKLSEKQLELSNKIYNIEPKIFLRKFLVYRKAALLANLKTMALNVTSWVALKTLNNFTDASFGRMFDIMITSTLNATESTKIFTKKIAKKTWNEWLNDYLNTRDLTKQEYTRQVASTFGDIFRYYWKWLQEAKEVMKTWVDTTRYIANRFDAYNDVIDPYSTNKIEATFGKFVNLIYTRWMEALDKPIKSASYSTAALEWFRVQAWKLWLKWKEFYNFVDKQYKELVEWNPRTDNLEDVSWEVQQVHKEAIKVSEEVSFSANNALNRAWVNVLSFFDFGTTTGYREKSWLRIAKKLERVWKLAKEEWRKKWLDSIELKSYIEKKKEKAIWADEKLRNAILNLAFMPRFVLEWINPFGRAVANSMSLAFAYSPLWVLKSAFSTWQWNLWQASKDLWRAVEGTIISATLYIVLWDKMTEFSQGKLSEYRLNQREWKLTPWFEVFGYSVWVQWMEPFTHFFLQSKLYERYIKWELNFAEVMKMYMEVKIDENYTRWLKDLVRLATWKTDFKQYMWKQVRSTMPTIISQMARTIDNTDRIEDWFIWPIIAWLPFFRSTLPEEYNEYGEVRKLWNNRYLNFVSQMISPLKISKVEENELDTELRRLKKAWFDVLPTSEDWSYTIRMLKPSKDSEKLDRLRRVIWAKEAEPEATQKIKLSDKEANMINKYVWSSLQDWWYKIIKNKEYKESTDEQKKKMLRAFSNDIVTRSRYKLSREWIIDEQEVPPETKLIYFLKFSPKDALRYYNENKKQIREKRLTETQLEDLEELKKVETLTLKEYSKLRNTQKYNHDKMKRILEWWDPYLFPSYIRWRTPEIWTDLKKLEALEIKKDAEDLLEETIKKLKKKDKITKKEKDNIKEIRELILEQQKKLIK